MSSTLLIEKYIEDITEKVLKNAFFWSVKTNLHKTRKI